MKPEAWLAAALKNVFPPQETRPRKLAEVAARIDQRASHRAATMADAIEQIGRSLDA